MHLLIVYITIYFWEIYNIIQTLHYHFKRKKCYLLRYQNQSGKNWQYIFFYLLMLFLFIIYSFLLVLIGFDFTFHLSWNIFTWVIILTQYGVGGLGSHVAIRLSIWQFDISCLLMIFLFWCSHVKKEEGGHLKAKGNQWIELDLVARGGDPQAVGPARKLQPWTMLVKRPKEGVLLWKKQDNQM